MQHGSGAPKLGHGGQEEESALGMDQETQRGKRCPQSQLTVLDLALIDVGAEASHIHCSDHKFERSRKRAATARGESPLVPDIVCRAPRRDSWIAAQSQCRNNSGRPVHSGTRSHSLWGFQPGRASHFLLIRAWPLSLQVLLYNVVQPSPLCSYDKFKVKQSDFERGWMRCPSSATSSHRSFLSLTLLLLRRTHAPHARRRQLGGCAPRPGLPPCQPRPHQRRQHRDNIVKLVERVADILDVIIGLHADALDEPDAKGTPLRPRLAASREGATTASCQGWRTF